MKKKLNEKHKYTFAYDNKTNSWFIIDIKSNNKYKFYSRFLNKYGIMKDGIL